MKLQRLEKAWFPFEDDPDQSEFEIVNLRSGELSEILSKTYVQKFEVKDTGAVPTVEVNSHAEKELIFVAAIKNWKNIYDEQGNVLECTKENKLRLARELDEDSFSLLYGFINECRDILRKKIQEEKDRNQKN